MKWLLLLYITTGNGYSSHTVVMRTMETRADCLRVANVHIKTGEGRARCVAVMK